LRGRAEWRAVCCSDDFQSRIADAQQWFDGYAAIINDDRLKWPVVLLGDLLQGEQRILGPIACQHGDRGERPALGKLRVLWKALLRPLAVVWHIFRQSCQAGSSGCICNASCWRKVCETRFGLHQRLHVRCIVAEQLLLKVALDLVTSLAVGGLAIERQWAKHL